MSRERPRPGRGLVHTPTHPNNRQLNPLSLQPAPAIDLPGPQSHNHEVLTANNLIDEYLDRQGYLSTLHQFRREILTKEGTGDSNNNSNNSNKQQEVFQFFKRAFSQGDYPGLLNLWDIYLVPLLQQQLGADEEIAVLKLEFQLHLYMAIYPFKLEVVKTLNNPQRAGSMAARSMAIFRHYIESRGYLYLQINKAFNSYKNLHKIAFPPTHPNYKHLFSSEWQTNIRISFFEFINKMFPAKEESKLVKMIRLRGSKAGARREKKLIGITETLFDVSNDLLTSIEKGKAVPRTIVTSLRERFEDLKGVIAETKAGDS